jgi:hypothetical protein
VLKGSRFKTPAEPGSVLVKCEEENGQMNMLQTVYHSGTGKWLHTMRWSRPELLNPVRELSKHMKVAAIAHLKALRHVMAYVMATPKRGQTLKPVGTWDGLKDYKFEISGLSDSDYAKDPDNCRSISGTSVFLCKAPVALRSRQQNMTTLSTVESELASGTQ